MYKSFTHNICVCVCVCVYIYIYIYLFHWFQNGELFLAVFCLNEVGHDISVTAKRSGFHDLIRVISR